MLLLAHDYGFAKSLATGVWQHASSIRRSRLILPTGICTPGRRVSQQARRHRPSRLPLELHPRTEASLHLSRYARQPARAFSGHAGDRGTVDEAYPQDAPRGIDNYEDGALSAEDALGEATAPLESLFYVPLNRSTNSLDSSFGSMKAGDEDIVSERTQLGMDEDEALHIHKKAQPTRSRNETYRRRLRLDNEHMLDLVDRKSSPRMLKKLLQPSPSYHLERALAEADDPKLLPRPRPRSVHDLSYRNARTLHIFNINGYRPPQSDDTVSLQSVTAKLVRSIVRQRGHGQIQDTLSDLPSDADATHTGGFLYLTFADLQALEKAGYSEFNAQAWAEILLEPDIERAADRLVAPCNTTPHRVGIKQSTPWFVMNFLLRREKVTAQALRQMLDYAWRVFTRLQDRSGPAVGNRQNQPPSLRMVMTVCVRLVRHARDVWPQALPNIIKLFTAHLIDARTEYYNKINNPIRPSLIRQLTFKCNRMLSQLSVSGSRYPVLSGTHQQRAQFDLIRKMMTHQPPLPINQEGHRALTKILLLLRKTPQERDWALLQARSWPPFKISRTRLDDPKDREYGTSTAGKSIHFMQGYGYPMRNWDLIAQVYSGWNPDGSPAVQQRALTPAVPTSVAGEPGMDELHAAIVASTRTIPEAWAAFLKFDSPDGKWRAIYMAMFKKLLVQEMPKHQRPKGLVHPENIPAVSGDGMEVFPPPSSPLEAIYLPSEPPTVEAFLDTLLERKFPIFGELMNMLLEKAPSLDFGLKVWSAGKLLRIGANQRTSWSTDHLLLLKSESQDHVDVLPKLPNDLVTAFVSFVTTHASTSTARLALVDRTGLPAGSWLLRPEHGLVYAYRLLMYYSPPHASAWNRLLKALTVRASLRHAISGSNRTKERFFPLVAWAMSGNVMRSMVAAGATPDHLSFQHLCDIAQQAAVSVKVHGLDRKKAILEGIEEQEDVERELVEAQLLMSQGSSLLRRRFVQLVGLDKERSTLEYDNPTGRGATPSHLAIPKAVVLHKYVRALGLLGDHEGIYSLVRWMVSAASDLHELQDTQLNGRQHMRRLIIALRVWLESPSRDFLLAERQIEIEPATEELVQLVRSEVEHVKRWGGWPSDDQVEKYSSRYQNYWS